METSSNLSGSYAQILLALVSFAFILRALSLSSECLRCLFHRAAFDCRCCLCWDMVVKPESRQADRTRSGRLVWQFACWLTQAERNKVMNILKIIS